MKLRGFVFALMAVAVTSFSVSSGAMASDKICFGSTKNDDTRGVVVTAEITHRNLSLKAIKGEHPNGTYPTLNTSVKGRDGKTYLEYNGGYAESQVTILVDEALLNDRTTGLIKIRARGEGFFNSVFVCKDDRG